MDGIELWEEIKKQTTPLDKKQVGFSSLPKRYKIQPKIHLKNTLDLHGYTIQDAYILFERFIKYHYQNKTRYIIVITGKGTSKREGLIHSEIEKWLDNNHLKPFISNFSWMNGNGALKIYLKKC